MPAALDRARAATHASVRPDGTLPSGIKHAVRIVGLSSNQLLAAHCDRSEGIVLNEQNRQSEAGPLLQRAARAAESRAREIGMKSMSTQQLARYSAADRPFCEEVVEPIGDSAIFTRNSYGALVLNASRVMFIDIDFETKEKSGSLFGWNKDARTELSKQLDRVEVWSQQHPQWNLVVY